MPTVLMILTGFDELAAFAEATLKKQAADGDSLSKIVAELRQLNVNVCALTHRDLVNTTESKTV